MNDTLVEIFVCVLFIGIVVGGGMWSHHGFKVDIMEDAAAVMVTQEPIDAVGRQAHLETLAVHQMLLPKRCFEGTWRKLIRERDAVRAELRFSHEEWKNLTRKEEELALMVWHCPTGGDARFTWTPTGWRD